MKIQHITYDGQSNGFRSLITVENKFNEAAVFDDFDLNIVDMTSEEIWKSKGNAPNISEEHDNLKTLSTQISQSKAGKTLILLPGNTNFRYHFNKQSKKYIDTKELKDAFGYINKGILQVLYSHEYELSFGKTMSRIREFDIPCDFYFSKHQAYEAVNTTAAGKVTTINRQNVYITTLQFGKSNALEAFLIEIGLMDEDKEAAPEWFAEIKAFDDVAVEERIDENQRKIEKAEEEIRLAEEVLNRNNYWKSILYTTGDELAETIKQMLDEIFHVNLSEFLDIKKEDFKFEYDNKIVIGEVKGVEHNVKKAYISQLDVHVQEYLDDHPDKTKDDIIALLIINHQRKVKPEAREHIPEDQIQLADRNESLIVESNTFLRLFEDYINKKRSESDIWDLFRMTTGLLKVLL